jgi:large subunit ribosomal protein L24
MSKIKKNDQVVILAGKDRGKTGKVLVVMPAEGKAIVEGVNFVHRHTRKSRDNQQGGIVKKEAPISISKVAVFCKRCNRGTKTGYSILGDGTKSRFCRKCNEVF